MRDLRSKPRRPLLTPVFMCAMALWCSCAVCYSACKDVGASICLTLVVCSAVSTFVMLVPAAFSKQRSACLILAALFVGVCIAGVDAYLLHDAESKVERPVTSEFSITTLEDGVDNGFGPRALCKVELATGYGFVVQAQFPAHTTLLNGQKYEVSGTLERIPQKNKDFAWQQGTCVMLRVKKVRGRIAQQPVDSLVAIRQHAVTLIGSDTDESGLLQALVCGYRENIRSSRSYSEFQSTGLAHFVAVSGAHLVIVISLLGTLLRMLQVPRKASIVLLVFAMGAYTVFAGMPISCIRASIMSSVGILALFGKRRASSLNALGISIIVILAIEPHAAVSASLALSALSTIGIVVFSPLGALALQDRVAPKVAKALQPFLLTMCASLLSQLYACSLFSQLPLVSPLANAVCAPLLPACCSLGLAGTAIGCFIPQVGSAILFLAGLFARLLVTCVNVLSSIPYACMPISIETMPAILVSLSIAALLWIGWERCLEARNIMLAGILAVSLAFGFVLLPTKDCIALLDVGQGDAFLIRSRGSTLLIDTGNHDRALIEQLARCRVAHLDGVLVSHADDDHCGSLDALEKAVDVDTVYLHEGIIDSADERCMQLVDQSHATSRHVVGVKLGDVLSVGRFSLRIVWPHELREEGGNADSVVVVANYNDDGISASEGDAGGEEGGITALFTGDAEREQLSNILAETDMHDIDILKVGHHGSKNSFDGNQLATLNPSIALIGVGEYNRYGHPSQETLDKLNTQGCRVFRSDEDGGVCLELDGGIVHARNL